jgi:rod shape-determining protein MreD
MSLLFAAIGSTMAALIEVTLTPYIAVGGASPHPVLVGGVIWTIAAGIDRGIAWAFVGGLILDALLGRPLGASAFALLVAVGGAAVIAQPIPQLRVLAPVVAVPAMSLLFSVLLFALTAAARSGIAMTDPVALFLPGAIYDCVLAVILGPLVVSLQGRRLAVERLEF